MKSLKKKAEYFKKKTKYTESETEAVIRHQLKELIIYVVFLTIFCIWIYKTMNPAMFYFTHFFRANILYGKYDDGFFGEISFKDVTTHSEVWRYLEHLVTNGFHWEYWYDDNNNPVANTSIDDRNIMYDNRLLGTPRIRQVRVRNDSCHIHYEFAEVFNTCYGEFTEENEDKSPFGLGNGTAWTYNSPHTHSHDTWGDIARYTGGGYYIDVAPSPDDAQRQIRELMNNLWINRHTRAVFIDFCVYNVNLNLFGVAKLIIEFPPSGGLTTSSDFVTLKFLENNTKHDFFVFACFWLLEVFVLYFVIEEILDFKSMGVKYFYNMWNVVDILIIYLILGYGIYYIYRRIQIKNYIKTVIENKDHHIHFEDFGYYQRLLYYGISLAFFFAWIKLFKYLNFNQTMSQLSNTLTRSSKDIIGFAVMFFIVFFAFSQLGFLLFGTETKDYSTFWNSVFTSLRTILGDFDYYELERANRILGPIFFLSFVFFVFFILLVHYFIISIVSVESKELTLEAIINDSYSEVKNEITVATTNLTIGEYVLRGWTNIKSLCKCKSRCCRCCQKKQEECIVEVIEDDVVQHTLTITHIKDLLKRANFTDLEIDAFMIQQEITVENLQVHSLRELLGHLFEETPTLQNPCQHHVFTDKEYCLDKSLPGDEKALNLAQRDFERYELHFETMNEKIDKLQKKVEGLIKKTEQLLEKDK